MAEVNDAFTGACLTRTVRLGERQVHGPLAVFPLFTDRDVPQPPRPRFVTLRQALAEGSVAVTEVSEGGSVPELRLVNKGDQRVLVLDGEELRGAKQNRVLNTTILVSRYSTLVVPVSCTEAGRWSYATPAFGESEIVAERQVRRAMRETTYAALAEGRGHRADQGRVWREVDALHARQQTHSETSAMRDSYAAKKQDLDEVLAGFPRQDHQKGVLVLHGERVVGLDYVSRSRQYADLHEKLLRSYAFEALVSDGRPADRDVAEAFVARIAGLEGRRFKSPGLGWDVRFQGSGVLGSALVYRGSAVHAAFFDLGADGGAGDVHGQGDVRRQPDWRIADARERARRRLSR
jgi:hypothetical protein